MVIKTMGKAMVMDHQGAVILKILLKDPMIKNIMNQIIILIIRVKE